MGSNGVVFIYWSLLNDHDRGISVGSFFTTKGQIALGVFSIVKKLFLIWSLVYIRYVCPVVDHIALPIRYHRYILS